jgi:hypothetical protein
MGGPRRYGPQPRRGVVLERDVITRVRLFVGRVGVIKARERLRVGADTLDAARDAGSIQASTAARLLEALEREEAVLLREAS